MKIDEAVSILRAHNEWGADEFAAALEAAQMGLTLRDYFAAKALPEVLAQKDVHGHIREWENAAWISYQIADAMLKAREASNG